MSADREPWGQCKCGKRGYKSATTARTWSSFIRNRLRVYRCHKDKSYLHLTDADKEPNHDFQTKKSGRRKKFKRTNDANKRRKLRNQ